MNFKYLVGIFCVLMLIMPMVLADDLVVLHGKAYDGNNLMATGDVRVQIYNAPAAGTMIYDSVEDFNGAITNGLFDVHLGSGISLDLNFGQNYYYSMQINAKDINFGTSLRQIFQSAHGDLNIYPISQLINDSEYVTSTDANGIYAYRTDVNTWAGQLDAARQADANAWYTLKSDSNVWTGQLIIAAQTDANKWNLTKLDANALFAFKTDVNLWGSQLYSILTHDHNGWYPLIADVNTWASELDRLMEIDSNKWNLTKLDANGFFALKNDVNIWIDQKIFEISPDTNWQTSWTAFDANMKSYYVVRNGLSGGQIIKGGTANGEDLSFWTNATGVIGNYYFTDLTDNGFVRTRNTTGELWIDMNVYATDSNVAGIYVPYTGATSDVNLGIMDLFIYEIRDLQDRYNIVVNQRMLYDDDENYSINWNVRQLSDEDENPSIQWDNRFLLNEASSIVIAWDSNLLLHKSITGAGHNITGINNLSATTLAGNLNWTYLQNYPTGCGVGQAVQSIGDTLTCVDVNSIVAADTNWQTSFGIFDANMKATYAVLGSVDTNWETSWDTFDANMKANYTQLNDTNIWANQLIFVAQSDSNQWTLTKLDANGFYALKTDVNVWANQLLVPYLTKVDANGFYTLKEDTNTWATQLIFVAQEDANNWNLTKLDANALFALKTDVNVWTNQLIAPYLLAADANAFFTLKEDTNVWANQLIVASEIDSNQWVLTKVDGNALYALKEDVNAWTNQLLVPYLLGADANGFYAYKTDVNLWGGQLYSVLTHDHNGWYPLIGDVNTWAGQLDAANQADANEWYLLKTDANLFYALLWDVNNWASQLDVVMEIDSNKWNLTKVDANGFFAFKTDVNTWANQWDVIFESDANKWNLTKLDANALFTLKSDTNTWATQLDVSMQTDANKWNLTKLDANGFYPLKADVNIWAGQLDAALLSKVDANGFFALKDDVNLWGGQLYVTYTGAINNVNLGDKNLITSGKIFTNFIDFNTDVVVADRYEGQLFYDTSWKTISAQIGRNVTLQIGQEELTRIYNDSGVDINNGQAVYTTGAYLTGDLNVLTVALADANGGIESIVYGVATQDIPDGNYGFVTVRGNINDLNTDISGWTPGDILYLSATEAGGLTNIHPDPPAITVKVARLISKSQTNGRIAVNILVQTSLDDLTNVKISNPSLDQVLRFNGLEWVNGAATSSSAGAGISFYPDTTDINSKDGNNATTIETLNKFPVNTEEKAESMSATATTVARGDAYFYNTDLNRTVIDAGTWTFNFYASVNSTLGGRESYLTNVIYRVIRYPDYTVNTVGTGTTRYVIASGDAPFAAAKIDVNDQNIYAGYLQTSTGIYKILARTSDTNITIQVPSTYTNQTGSWFHVWKNLLQASSPIITTVGTNYSLLTLSESRGSYDANLTDRLGMIIYAHSNNTTSVNYVYNGTDHYSYFTTPLITLHNNLSGLQGGSAEEFFHLSNAQYTIATQAASSTTDGYLTSGDWTTFSGKIDATVLVPYLSKADANAFYPLKADVNVWAGQLDVVNQNDANKWNLTKLDANALFALKDDVNTWINQLNTIQETDANKWNITKTDANALFTLKSDTNTWIDQKIAGLSPDTNWQTSWADFDANMQSYYSLKNDVNIWIDQKLVGVDTNWQTSWSILDTNLNTSYAGINDVNEWIGQLDTNWQNSWAILDANLNSTYTLKSDTNTWIDQKIAGLAPDTNWETSWSDFDANMKSLFAGIADVNTWIDQKIVGLSADTNWFTSWAAFDLNMKANYTQLADTNIWIDQKIAEIPTDTNWQNSWTAFDTNMIGTFREYTIDLNTTADVKANALWADNNIYIGTNGYIYDDGNAIIIGRR